MNGIQLMLTFSLLVACVCMILAGALLVNNFLIALGVLGCCTWFAFGIWFINSKYGNL